MKKVVVKYQTPARRTAQSMSRVLQITILSAVAASVLPMFIDYLSRADFSAAAVQRLLVSVGMVLLTTVGVGIKKYTEILQEEEQEASTEVLAPEPSAPPDIMVS